MAVSRINVTTVTRANNEIPERFTVAVLAWSKLVDGGLIEKVGERLLLDRKDGCTGSILFAKLLLMSFGNVRGQRALQRAASGCETALAAVIGCRRWYRQAAMSRALKSVTAQQSRAFSDWLLCAALPVGALDRSEHAAHRDTLGGQLRVFDVDGRVRAIRQRGLPESNELPASNRMAAPMAKPGYPGRKRGEVQFHQLIVQDAGTSRWIGTCIGPGGGDHRRDMNWAVDRVVAFTNELGISPSDACLRFDGKASGAPSLLACLEVGIKFVTRLAARDWLKEPTARILLERKQWRAVSDSGSGPTREAMEFGTRDLQVLQQVEGEEKTDLSDARVVVSRFRVGEKGKRGCGKEIDGYVYELYATALAADAWPAAELVELYYGRSAQENAFGRLDQQAPVSHIISWHAPGQELATAVNLFCWNFKLLWGAQLAGWRPCELPKQPPRLPVALAAADPSSSAVIPTISLLDDNNTQPVHKTSNNNSDLLKLKGNDVPRNTPDEQPNQEDLVSPQTAAILSRERVQNDAHPGVSRTSAVLQRQQIELMCLAIASMLRVPTVRARLPGWVWNESANELHCPQKQPMRLHAIRHRSTRARTVVFRIRSNKTCGVCPQKSDCSRSQSALFRKEVAFTVPTTAPRETPTEAAKPSPRKKTGSWRYTLAAASPPEGGASQAMAAALISSVLRHKVAEAFAGYRVQVTLPNRIAIVRIPPWLCSTAAQRQHRRRTTSERHQLPMRHVSLLELQLHAPKDKVSRRSAIRAKDSITARTGVLNW